MRFFYLFFTWFLLAVTLRGQTGAQSAAEAQAQTARSQAAPSMEQEKPSQAFRMKTHSGLRRTIGASPRAPRGTHYRRGVDEGTARVFFLVALGAAVLFWGIYLLLALATASATTGILLALAGVAGILAVVCSLAAVLGFVVWLVALAG